jgi:hypothetical protein
MMQLCCSMDSAVLSTEVAVNTLRITDSLFLQLHSL